MTEDQTIEVLASLRSINSALSAIALLLTKQANPPMVATQTIPMGMSVKPSGVTYTTDCRSLTGHPMSALRSPMGAKSSFTVPDHG